MNIEETKKIIQNKIEAEALTKNVRSQIKSYIDQKQNVREGFKDTFQPLIASQDAVKASIDKQQNAMIKQLQENQLVLTEGLDKNKLAITQDFDKMDEVRRWDLDQRPGIGAIEKLDEKEIEEESEEDILKKINDLENLIIKKNDLVNKLVAESKAKFEDGNVKDANKLLNEVENQFESIEILRRKIKRFYQSLGEEYEEESVEKPGSVAQFKFEDLDKGLNNKKARDILKEYGLSRLPSEYKDKTIEKINQKIEKVREYFNVTKIKLKDTAIPKFNKKEGFEIASPISSRPQPKTLDLIEKHNTLRRYIHNLNNLKIFKENITPKTGTGILHFNNPLQLLDRLELLAGSLLAGHNGVIQEFSQIAHLLHQLKVITKKQLNDLLKKYILNK